MPFIPGVQGWFDIHKSINMAYHINKIKDKNHMIISIDEQKAFNKIQHPFIIKTLNTVGIEGAYLNIGKAIYDEPISYIIHRIASSSHRNQARKRNKSLPIGKEEVKLSLLADDIML